MTPATPNVPVDEAVDQFVERMNRNSHDRRSTDELPEFLRIGEPDEYGYYGWTIVKTPNAHRIAQYEATLPCRLPPSFRSLTARYRYPAFDVAAIRLFANTGDDLWDEMTVAVVRDQLLCKVLLRSGYLQFARPEDGDYDPVCFNIKNYHSNGEYSIVRLDHEEILCKERIRVVTDIAPSFLRLIEDK